jgi:hypothetical protein
MAFNSTELAHIHATVGDLVERRQPPAHLQKQIRLELGIEGHRVQISTIRPQWNDPSKTIKSPVAQFTYTRTKDRWTLYWMRQDLKWHVWKPSEHIMALDKLVQVVDEDVHGGFWG